MSLTDYYGVLGISSDANQDVIKEAYRRLVKRYHPDINREAEAVRRFIEVQQAYDILIDPIKRKEYDDKRRKESGKSLTKVSDHASTEHRYIFPSFRINVSTILDFGEIEYMLSPDGANTLCKQGFLRGVAQKTRNHKNYCHRCRHQWEAQSPRLSKHCSNCRANDWSEFFLLRCSHCSAVFESEGDIREKLVEDQKGKLFSPYELFPRCPNCKRSKWCLGEEERLQTLRKDAQTTLQSEEDQHQTASSLASLNSEEDAQHSFKRKGYDDKNEQSSQRQGTDLHYDLTIIFEESVFGCTREIEVPRWETCPTCWDNDVQSGTLDYSCEGCFGQGLVYANRRIIVNIPAGVDDGASVQVVGEGGVNARGEIPGNLYLDLIVEPHPFFERQGNDIFYELAISMTQATLGDEVKVPTINEGPTLLKIPPGTQNNGIFRLKSRGIPVIHSSDCGDQWIVVKIVPR